MNKVLKALDSFISQKGLQTENFVETEELSATLPKSLKPTSILTVKEGETPLFVVACDRTNFWLDVLGESSAKTMLIKKELEKTMKENNITQVR